MVELSRAQRVNRFVEDAFSDNQPCQWAVFPKGTCVMFSGASLSSQAHLGTHARNVLQSSGIEGGTFVSIEFFECGLIVDFTPTQRDRPRGVRIFGVFPNIEAASSRRAMADYSMGLAPVVVNCNTALPPIASPDEYEEDEGYDDDIDSNLSDDTDVDIERRLRSCDPR